MTAPQVNQWPPVSDTELADLGFLPPEALEVDRLRRQLQAIAEYAQTSIEQGGVGPQHLRAIVRAVDVALGGKP